MSSTTIQPEGTPLAAPPVSSVEPEPAMGAPPALTSAPPVFTSVPPRLLAIAPACPPLPPGLAPARSSPLTPLPPVAAPELAERLPAPLVPPPAAAAPVITAVGDAPPALVGDSFELPHAARSSGTITAANDCRTCMALARIARLAIVLNRASGGGMRLRPEYSRQILREPSVWTGGG